MKKLIWTYVYTESYPAFPQFPLLGPLVPSSYLHFHPLALRIESQQRATSREAARFDAFELLQMVDSENICNIII